MLQQVHGLVSNICSDIGFCCRSLLPTVGTSEAERGLELRFIGNLCSTIFTGGRIVTEDGGPIRLELTDATTNRIVAMGPLSSMKLEIVVLNGDFGSEGREDWTGKDFNANIIQEREGKRPLLNGELSVTLRGGVGHLGELAFTDNSSWVRSRRFRLGARTPEMIPTQVRIREARSETFMVKDHRGECKSWLKYMLQHLSFLAAGKTVFQLFGFLFKPYFDPSYLPYFFSFLMYHSISFSHFLILYVHGRGTWESMILQIG